MLVAGILSHRPTTAALAEALAQHLTVLTYDRRGRGESADAATDVVVEREVEDLAALGDVVGAPFALYGHSSGAGLALRAAAAGLPLTHLVLHEPPFGPDDPQSVAESQELDRAITGLLDEGRHADAVGRFLGDYGLPPEALAEATSDPAMLALAPSMRWDFAVMAMAEGLRCPRTSPGPSTCRPSCSPVGTARSSSAGPPST